MQFKSSRHRLPPFKQDGLLLIDKPKTWTSFDVVNCLRWQFNIPKLGHCGTLDPAATGLLILVAGRFTQLSQKFSGDDKIYEADMLLGTQTDSQDLDGKITAQTDVSHLSPEPVLLAINSFAVGEQLQTPPMVSAVKKDGKKLYELARKGIEVERDAKPIVIHSITINAVELPHVRFTVHCSKGTYIRTLCSDIGAKIGCGAVLSDLRRTRSGIFDIADALPVEEVKIWEQDRLGEHMATYLGKVLGKIKV